MCLMEPPAACLFQGILGDIKSTPLERRSDAHVFVEHKLPTKFTNQSVDFKEIVSMDTDDNLHNLKISDGGVLVTLFMLSLAISLSFKITSVYFFSETDLIYNIC